jgi:hypothetical protein
MAQWSCALSQRGERHVRRMRRFEMMREASAGEADAAGAGTAARPVSAEARTGHRARAGAPAACLATSLLALLAASCAMTPSETPTSRASVAAPASVTRQQIVGRWGIASFHTEKDRRRTEAEARAQCGQPYVIALGPTDGVMMHVADDPKLYELRLKGDAAGRNYIGFEAPPGDPQDREILSFTDRVMTLRFVDPDANARYGTFVYARCGAA